MRFAYILFSLVGFGFSQTAFGQSMEPWNLPDPDEMISASNVLCTDQAKSVLVAVSLRNKGHKVEDVLGLIPTAPRALSLRVVSAMRENVEDLFQFFEISQYAYYSFRSEVCMRETLGAVRIPRFVTMRSKVLECQTQHGSDKSSGLFKCIQGVVRDAVPL